MVHMPPWYDPYPLSATSNYIGLNRAGKGTQRLILGPWTHGGRSDSSLSSNFPKFGVNPNTGEPEGLARRKRVAVNTVFVDADRPSAVVLPLMRRRCEARF